MTTCSAELQHPADLSHSESLVNYSPCLPKQFTKVSSTETDVAMSLQFCPFQLSNKSCVEYFGWFIIMVHFLAQIKCTNPSERDTTLSWINNEKNFVHLFHAHNWQDIGTMKIWSMV